MENQTVTVVVRDDGELVCLDNDSTAWLKPLGHVTTRRASHVEPDKWPLRLIFHVLRWFFGDKGWMATFTRHWPCLWRVNVSPLHGPILPGRWRDRQEAIEAEVEWLNENLY